MRFWPRFRIYWGWYVVLAAFLASTVAASASGFVFSVIVKPMTTAMGWTRTEFFLAITIGGIVAGVLSPLTGRLVDRYGARYIMAGGALFLAGSLLLTSQVTNLWQYYLVYGLGLGVSRPLLQSVAGPTAVVNWFVRKRNRVLPILAAASSASALMIFPVTYVIGNYDWRLAWVLLGSVALIFGVFPAWFFIRKRPEDMGLLPYGLTAEEAEAAQSRVEGESSLSELDPGWRLSQVLRMKAFWLISANFVLTGVPGGTIILHMGAFFSDKGFSPAAAATGVFLYASGAGVARVLWGVLGEWFSVKRLITALSFAYSLGILGLLAAPGQLSSYVAVVTLGMIVGGSMQLHSQAWADYFGRGIVGSILGVQLVISTISTGGGPIFAAWMFDAFGNYNSAFSIFSGLCVVAGFAMAFARKPKLEGLNSD